MFSSGVKSLPYPSLIKLALKEDIGKGDITSLSLIPEGKIATAKIIAKEQGIIAGVFILKDVYAFVDRKVRVVYSVKDGKEVKRGDVIAFIYGPAISILKGERVALNFLQHLSGIATLTKKITEKIKPYPVKILDTRKTIPLYRFLEKYAVKVGGGHNHRFGLDDMILIKENHLFLSQSIKDAIEKAKKVRGNKLIEIEVSNTRELESAISCKPDIIMLDNMTIPQIKKAVKITPKEIKLEASGGINLKNVKKVAMTGVQFISVGAITHSAEALDLSLKIVK